MDKSSAAPSPDALSGTHAKAAKARERTATGHVPTVLVVDGDRVSRRFVELALATDPHFVVEVVSDAQSAFDLSATQIIDLIVAETILPDMSGLQFYRRLSRESRLREVPFVFLSADARPETKLAALRAGVDEYLCKPCAPKEFVARIDAILHRQRRRRDEAKNKGYTLAGDFSTMSFPDLVSILELGVRTGVLAVTTERASGRVFFEAGRIVHAVYGTLSKAEAFYSLMADDRGQFEFTPGACTLDAKDKTITQSATALIMEGARRFDHARRSAHPHSSDHGPCSPGSVHPHVDAALIEAPKADAVEARHYELALRESFTLGDLRLFSEDTLSAFTHCENVKHRFHLWLIADAEEGVSVLLPLAGAPSESLLLASLEPGPKALGLSFDLRDERLFDVLLIDAASPTAFRQSLKRIPSVVVLAPPRGDIMALGMQARVALKSLFDEFSVSAVVGVGHATLEEGLARIGIASTTERLVCCLRGVLGDSSLDLRRLLLYSLRLWLSSAAETAVDPGAATG